MCVCVCVSVGGGREQMKNEGMMVPLSKHKIKIYKV